MKNNDFPYPIVGFCLSIAVLFGGYFFPTLMEYKIFGIMIAEWGLLVAIVTGIVIPIIKFYFDWRKEWKDNHPKVKIEANPFPNVIEEGKVKSVGLNVWLTYIRGGFPVSFSEFTLYYKDDEGALFGSTYPILDEDGKEKEISLPTPTGKREDYFFDVVNFPKMYDDNYTFYGVKIRCGFFTSYSKWYLRFMSWAYYWKSRKTVRKEWRKL